MIRNISVPDFKSNDYQIAQYFPIIRWLKNYTRRDFNDDIFAGIITAILLVPQGIAYAILAGLPPDGLIRQHIAHGNLCALRHQ